MELLKIEIAALKFRDATFFFRTHASIGDKLAVEAIVAGALTAKDIDSLPKIGMALVKLFMCGWEGVTAEGKIVPFSHALIETSFPAEITDELIPQLVKFVKESVDILK